MGISKYWSLHLLKMLRCAQKPRHSYLKGNASANSIYEAFVPEGSSKPGPDVSHDQRLRFISAPRQRNHHFLKSTLSTKFMDSFRANSSSKKIFEEGMVEFIGLLKKGTNLAIRDMMSSDPYVVLNLGKQKLQTTVVNSNLNPIWNQELMLSVPESYGPVKLCMIMTLLSDDIMGEAELDIQPLITSAMAFGDPEMFGDMQIGKWLKSHDNPLIDEQHH
ncbi:hypothetical protein HID58_057764 [Brassica napus]|uniref:C2 domain-containing protein n=1 Tax=Brassica napus TaxID=3708 RepID=A0ABQ7XHY1_BRANA|nr:hypothetical protein HID58_057764 [Brassica napus]